MSMGHEDHRVDYRGSTMYLLDSYPHRAIA